MRALVQRVSRARVTSRPPAGGPGDATAEAVADERDEDPAVETGAIGAGLVALVGVTHDDGPAQAHKLADKLWHLRVFDDDDGTMNRSCADVGGEVLVVSQFTLYGDTRKGRRPSYVAAARPEHAEPLVEAVVARLRDLGATVATGRFRTHMEVSLVNDGPVTLLLEV